MLEQYNTYTLHNFSYLQHRTQPCDDYEPGQPSLCSTIRKRVDVEPEQVQASSAEGTAGAPARQVMIRAYTKEIQ